MPSSVDIKRVKTITGDLAWVMGDKPKTFNKKRNIVPLTEKELNVVLFPKAVFAKLFVPGIYNELSNDVDKYDYIEIPAGTTLEGYTNIVNTFYRMRIKKDDPRYQSMKGKKLIGKSRLSLLGDTIFYEGDLGYTDYKYEKKDVVVFGLGS